MAHDDTPAEARSTSVTVGGEVDEVRVTLALYGDELDPAEVSQLLERISKIPLLRPPIHQSRRRVLPPRYFSTAAVRATPTGPAARRPRDAGFMKCALGCQPTDGHRRGERRVGKKTGREVVYKQGAWLLRVEGKAPRSADELTREVLAKLSCPDAVWLTLRQRFDVQLRYGLFVEAWNRGFGLSRDTLQACAAIGASLEFDIYANLDDAESD